MTGTRITALWRYPLKSARGEPLTSARVEKTGFGSYAEVLHPGELRVSV